eukprot:655971-Amphidinium_carterae.1
MQRRTKQVEIGSWTNSSRRQHFENRIHSKVSAKLLEFRKEGSGVDQLESDYRPASTNWEFNSVLRADGVYKYQRPLFQAIIVDQPVPPT